MKDILLRLRAGEHLTREEMCDVMVQITHERYNHSQIAALLMALEMRGTTVDELLGLRDGLLATGRSVDLGDVPTLDIVGTGGDGKNTFNISTCAAFAVAGAGYYVAKHGNAAATSVSGASNVLQHFGAKFTAEPDRLRRSLAEAHICYLHAPLFATGMKFVGPVRRELGIPTCFNLLGPLVNPSHPRHSLHGTATPAQHRLYTLIHQRLGDSFGVVTSYDGYDEISLTSGFKLTTNSFEKVFTPKDLGLDYVQPSDISAGATADDAARVFLAVLNGTATQAQTDVVVANAACGISVIDRNLSQADTVALARESLQSGRAYKAFRKFIEINA